MLNSWDMKKGNVANQREHLILLLANIDGRGRNPGDYTQVNPFSFETLFVLFIKLCFMLYLFNSCFNLHFFLSPLIDYNLVAVGKWYCSTVGGQDF